MADEEEKQDEKVESSTDANKQKPKIKTRKNRYDKEKQRQNKETEKREPISKNSIETVDKELSNYFEQKTVRCTSCFKGHFPYPLSSSITQT